MGIGTCGARETEQEILRAGRRYRKKLACTLLTWPKERNENTSKIGLARNSYASFSSSQQMSHMYILMYEL